MLSIQSPGADVRKGEGRGWANADKSGQGGGRGSILADILQTCFMDDLLTCCGDCKGLMYSTI